MNDLKKAAAEAVKITTVISTSRKFSLARCSNLSLSMFRVLMMKRATTKVTKKWVTVTIPRTML